MLEWWNALDLIAKIFYCIAIPSTLLIVIQTIMLMIGMGGHTGDASDFNTSDFASDTDVSGDFDVSDVSDGVHDGHGHMGDNCDGTIPGDMGTLQIFTLQGIMAFLCVFGWCGILLNMAGLHIALTIAISFVAGALAMYAIAKVIQMSRRLTQNGSLDKRNFLGAKGNVYIPIPSSGNGSGKITVTGGERNFECDAITDENDSIPTGTPIRITDIRGALVVVEKDI